MTQSKKFLIKLVGTLTVFDRERLVSYFRGLVLTRAKDIIAKYIVRDEVSILEIAAHLNDISEALKKDMVPELDEFGLELIKFFVNSINTPETDPAVARLKQALARKAEMEIVGYTYQEQRSFDTMETAAGNRGFVTTRPLPVFDASKVTARTPVPLGRLPVELDYKAFHQRLRARIRGAVNAIGFVGRLCHVDIALLETCLFPNVSDPDGPKGAARLFVIGVYPQIQYEAVVAAGKAHERLSRRLPDGRKGNVPGHPRQAAFDAAGFKPSAAAVERDEEIPAGISRPRLVGAPHPQADHSAGGLDGQCNRPAFCGRLQASFGAGDAVKDGVILQYGKLITLALGAG
ncbi:MAG: SPFH domain-containing protein [Planctomycetes bacterium]|nr:SPFH domain-containing protein [Planctomycetota bacterium]